MSSDPMPSSSKQAACSSSLFIKLADHQIVMHLVQAVLYAGHCARLIGQLLRSAENTARVILRKLASRPFLSDANIAAPSPVQDVAVFINPMCGGDSPVQVLEEITNYKRGGRLIGRGAVTSVYARSNDNGLLFAVKQVSLGEHKQLRHLENEVAILERLDHENVIRYYGTVNNGEMVYVLLELAAHGTLQQAYKHCRFTEYQVADFTRQILHGLAYLHSCRVLHGDLNCANILVAESGRVKLADFGLSKIMEDHSQAADPKRGGYGFSSDILSLGCTVLEMSTGGSPQSNAKNVLISEELAIRSGRGLIVPDYLSDALKGFINQCLQRPSPTATELLAHPFVNDSSLHADESSR